MSASDLAGAVESLQQVQAADREARRQADQTIQRHALSV